MDVAYYARIAVAVGHVEKGFDGVGGELHVIVEQAEPVSGGELRAPIGGDGKPLVVLIKNGTERGREAAEVILCLEIAAIIDQDDFVLQITRDVRPQRLHTLLSVSQLVENGDDKRDLHREVGPSAKLLSWHLAMQMPMR